MQPLAGANEVKVNKSPTGPLLLNSMEFFNTSRGIYCERFVQEVGGGGLFVSSELGGLDVFRSTVEVMLSDGVLTREEKRLIIKLASALGLAADEPAYIYESIQTNRSSRPGDPINREAMRAIYTKVFEVAIVNASLSKDEFRVLAHLRSQFDIDDDMHASIEHELREMVKEKYEDKAVIDTLMGTIKDSVGLVGDLFDAFRKKSNEGGSR